MSAHTRTPNLDTTPTPQPAESDWRHGLADDEIRSVFVFISGWFKQGDPAEHAKAMSHALAMVGRNRASAADRRTDALLAERRAAREAVAR
jgi:hypothetical protein